MDVNEPIKVGHLEITYNEGADTWDVRDARTREFVYCSKDGVSYLGGVTDAVLYAVASLNRETGDEREEMHVWLCDAAQVG